MAASNTYDAIESITLTNNSSSVTFNSIPQTYTDLVIIMEAKSDTLNPDFYCQFNSDTGSNYSATWLNGNGTAASSSRNSNQTQIRISYGVEFSSTNANLMIAHIMNYSNSTTYKTLLARLNQAADGTEMCVGLWRSTAAISTIKLYPSANNFASGSTFTLYGIKAA